MEWFSNHDCVWFSSILVLIPVEMKPAREGHQVTAWSVSPVSAAQTARHRGWRQTGEHKMPISPDLLSNEWTVSPPGTESKQQFTWASSLTRFGMCRLSELSTAARQTICWLQEPLPTSVYFGMESLQGTDRTLRIRNTDNVCFSHVTMRAAVLSAPNSSVTWLQMWMNGSVCTDDQCSYWDQLWSNMVTKELCWVKLVGKYP